jgi:hypothetical protein
MEQDRQARDQVQDGVSVEAEDRARAVWVVRLQVLVETVYVPVVGKKYLIRPGNPVTIWPVRSVVQKWSGNDFIIKLE